jgi:hypothetical protein
MQHACNTQLAMREFKTKKGSVARVGFDIGSVPSFPCRCDLGLPMAHIWRGQLIERHRIMQ